MACETSVLHSIVGVCTSETSLCARTDVRHLGVRNNIEAFGGDPGNVVAIGQSVGASSIALHLLSYPGTRGVPFQKAM